MIQTKLSRAQELSVEALVSKQMRKDMQCQYRTSCEDCGDNKNCSIYVGDTYDDYVDTLREHLLALLNLGKQPRAQLKLR